MPMSPVHVEPPTKMGFPYTAITKGETNPEVLTLLKSFFQQKKMAPSFFIEYENNNLFRPPNMTDDFKEKRVVIVENNNSYYYSKKMPFDYYQVYLKSPQFKFFYSEAATGDNYFVSNKLHLDKLTPEAWLQEHEFDTISDFEMGLFMQLDVLFKQCKVIDQFSNDDEKNFVLSTTADQKMKLMVNITKGILIVNHVADKNGKNLLSYIKTNGTFNKKNDPRGEMLAKFSKAPPSDVLLLKGEFTLFSILDKIGDQNKGKVVTSEEARNFAKKKNLLFPKNKQPYIKKAETAYNQLVLDIEKDGKTYTVIQTPTDSRVDLPDGFVIQKRQFMGYEVIEIRDDDVNRETRYVKDRIEIMIQGPNLFNDRILDGIILSLEPVK